jgi:hypothetical protein
MGSLFGEKWGMSRIHFWIFQASLNIWVSHNIDIPQGLGYYKVFTSQCSMRCKTLWYCLASIFQEGLGDCQVPTFQSSTVVRHILRGAEPPFFLREAQVNTKSSDFPFASLKRFLRCKCCVIPGYQAVSSKARKNLEQNCGTGNSKNTGECC